MKKYNSKLKNFGYLCYRWVYPFVDPITIIRSIVNYPLYFRSAFRYSKMVGSEHINIIDTYPILSERISETPFDAHYFYQDIWAAKKIFQSKTKVHYDIGSNVEFVGFLTSFTKVNFVDIRPLRVRLPNLKCIEGDILDLPFKTDSINSISCLHVAEHIGLGRYGDSLDPEGTKKACQELSRVLAKGGYLYFSLPVGKPRVCFNAHRIHSPAKIIKYFDNLELVEFSGIDDNGNYIENIKTKVFEKFNYACGLFIFTKK